MFNLDNNTWDFVHVGVLIVLCIGAALTFRWWLHNRRKKAALLKDTVRHDDIH